MFTAGIAAAFHSTRGEMRPTAWQQTSARGMATDFGFGDPGTTPLLEAHPWFQSRPSTINP
ncbi:hypothetical protein SJA_C1-20170 [Sphingobium indicum UT26S]|uniref:Uncharacterized protein n=1 Tax=Sphingobium indicum (strain DSM 16413 / CCM 7287 / MTCC 6362 / UT26 / NBRC 101211 / UT26S) TaxID=452662 RepID=D4Z2L9_SPHIU|nr:hypothetical protein SJA_C1-20170 [Sphingobium indicum UT26S]